MLTSDRTNNTMCIAVFSHRNPVAGSRPDFREILLPLIDQPDAVLYIPPEALDTDHLDGVLGSPLEAGENMYCDFTLYILVKMNIQATVCSAYSLIAVYLLVVYVAIAVYVSLIISL